MFNCTLDPYVGGARVNDININKSNQSIFINCLSSEMFSVKCININLLQIYYRMANSDAIQCKKYLDVLHEIYYSTY